MKTRCRLPSPEVNTAVTEEHAGINGDNHCDRLSLRK